MTDIERLEEIKEWFNADEEIHEFQIEWLIEQVEEFERYKKYALYFCGKDKLNDIRLAMDNKELDSLFSCRT